MDEDPFEKMRHDSIAAAMGFGEPPTEDDDIDADQVRQVMELLMGRHGSNKRGQYEEEEVDDDDNDDEAEEPVIVTTTPPPTLPKAKKPKTAPEKQKVGKKESEGTPSVDWALVEVTVQKWANASNGKLTKVLALRSVDEKSRVWSTLPGNGPKASLGIALIVDMAMLLPRGPKGKLQVIHSVHDVAVRLGLGNLPELLEVTLKGMAQGETRVIAMGPSRDAALVKSIGKLFSIDTSPAHKELVLYLSIHLR